MITGEFVIREVEETKVLQISTVVPMAKLPEALGEIYNKVLQYLDEIGKEPAGPAFAAYYNQDMDALEVDAGFVVAEDIPETETIKMGAIEACKAASYIHTGPYTELEEAYGKLMKWAEDQGVELEGAGYELYFNSPAEVPPDQLKTEILFPIK
ncbi:MAG: GyrI-like domain-containing protein [Firmicutes bacterium]|nr:GyrI-like domain-containing protein [Bacillota bacterium]